MTTLVKGFDTAVTVMDQDTTNLLNQTNTEFEPGDPEVGVVFMAPTSGRVMVIVGGGGRNNTGPERLFMFGELYVGTQAVPENLVADAFARDLAIPGEADESVYLSYVTVYEDLTPLAVHYARHTHRVAGGSTGDIFVREIVGAPLP